MRVFKLCGSLFAAGDFVCGDSGARLGRHSGMELYTLGQKARIPNMASKYFVAAKCPSSGDVTVVAGTHHPALMCDSLTADARAFVWGAQGVPPELLRGQSMRVHYKVGSCQCMLLLLSSVPRPHCRLLQLPCPLHVLNVW